jgi:putative inorganic carbon (hco3(-)) transporter
MSYFMFGLLLVLTYLKPVETFFPELADLRIALIVTVLAFLGTTFVRVSDRTKYFEIAHVGLLILMFVAIFASQATKGWFGGAVDSVYNFSFSAVFFILTVWNMRSTSQLRATATLIVLCAFALACASIAAIHYGFMEEELIISDSMVSSLSETGFLTFQRVRSIGFLNDPNDFSQFLLVALVFSLALFRKKRWLIHGVLLAVVSSVFLYTIYLTQSRGAIVGFSVLVFIYLSRAIGLVKAGTVSLPIFIVVAGLGLLGGGRSISADDSSAGGRVEAWSQGLLMLKSKPIFGVGYDGFTEFHSHTAHNSLVLCFAELGLVGYFAWAGLLIFIVLSLNELLPKSGGKKVVVRDEIVWLRALLTAILIYITCSMFLSRTYSPTLYILLGMGVAVIRLSKEELTRQPDWKSRLTISPSLVTSKKWAITTIVFMVLSIAMIHLSTRVYWLGGA